MKTVVIAAAPRTAIGNLSGSLSEAHLPNVLGSHAVCAVLRDAQVDPKQVDALIFGQVLTAGCGQNAARQTAMAAGLLHSVLGMTANKVCGSGLWSVQLAAQSVACGDTEIIVAGGPESMSQALHLPQSRSDTRLGDQTLPDSVIWDGLWDTFHDIHMGVTAEHIAKAFNISRTHQNGFAATSQQKAETVIAAGHFHKEIVSVTVPQRSAVELSFDTDEFPCRGVTAASLADLQPAFTPEGTVTAGNASGINDGAVVVMSAKRAEQPSIEPLAEISACASAGVDRLSMGTGPVPASKCCLEKAGRVIDVQDLIESE